MGLTGDHRGNLLAGKSWKVKMGRRTSSLSEKRTIDLQSAEHFITSNSPKQPNLVCAVTLSPNTDIETLVFPTSPTVQDSAHSHHDSALGGKWFCTCTMLEETLECLVLQLSQYSFRFCSQVHATFCRLLKWITDRCEGCFIQSGQFNTTLHFAIYYRNDTKPPDTRVGKYKNAEHPDSSGFVDKTKPPKPPQFLSSFLLFFPFKAAITLYTSMSSLPLCPEYCRDSEAPWNSTSTWTTTFQKKLKIILLIR